MRLSVASSKALPEPVPLQPRRHGEESQIEERLLGMAFLHRRGDAPDPRPSLRNSAHPRERHEQSRLLEEPTGISGRMGRQPSGCRAFAHPDFAEGNDADRKSWKKNRSSAWARLEPAPRDPIEHGSRSRTRRRIDATGPQRLQPRRGAVTPPGPAAVSFAQIRVESAIARRHPALMAPPSNGGASPPPWASAVSRWAISSARNFSTVFLRPGSLFAQPFDLAGVMAVDHFFHCGSAGHRGLFAHQRGRRAQRETCDAPHRLQRRRAHAPLIDQRIERFQMFLFLLGHVA